MEESLEKKEDTGKCDSEYPSFTFKELAQYDGVKNPRRYLSILGEIYDVTVGKNAAMYEKPKPYSCFVGRDATVAFITGDFVGQNTPLQDAWDYSVLGARKMADAVEWARFYATHETYKRVGTLVYPDGNDPKLRAVSPYDPLIEQCTLVDHYHVDWVCGNSSTWTPDGVLCVNYRNIYGGLAPVTWGTPLLEEEAAIPPRASWVSKGLPEEVIPHSLVALWTKAAPVKKKSGVESQAPLRMDPVTETEVPEHIVFWGVTSTTKALTGKDTRGKTEGVWTSPDDARKQLGLPSDAVLCLIFVWLHEALPSCLPQKFWRPTTVGAIHFCFTGPQNAVEEFIKNNGPRTPERKKVGGEKGDCVMT